jgi:thiosulfate sulfurtransferase
MSKAMNKSTTEPTTELRRIDIVGAQDLISQGAHIADIRQTADFAAAHISGAQHLDNASLAQFINTVDYDEPIIVCCYHGISSLSAANYLISQGFTQVYSLEGGFEAWRNAGFNSESGIINN